MKRTPACLALSAALLLTGTATASAATLTVDDDKQQCRSAQFTTIQAALVAAAPGDTVRVCPGTYTGPVPVIKPVTLVALARGAAAANSAPDPTRDAIVTNTGAGGFDVVASDVRITAFRVQGDALANGYPDAGVYVRTGTNRRLDFNLLEDNNLGVYVEGSQERLAVSLNAIQGSTRPDNPSFIPTGGLFAAGGEAGGGLVDTTITNNLFRSNEQFSINNGSGSDRGFVVSGNRALDDGAFVVIGRAAGARITGNDVRRHNGSGVFSFGGNTDLLIADNEFREGSTGVNDSLPVFGVVVKNLGTIVRDNEIVDQRNSGVALNSDPQATVEDNRLDRNLNGVNLGTTGARIFDNEMRSNRKDGILARAESRENRIFENVALGNVEHDCHDDSVGTGTAGTANLWRDNEARTENRPGLCDSDDDDDDRDDD